MTVDKQREHGPGRGLGLTARRVRSATSAGLLVLGVLAIPAWSGLGESAQAATESKPIAAKVPGKKVASAAPKKPGAAPTKLAQAPVAKQKGKRGQPLTLN